MAGFGLEVGKVIYAYYFCREGGKERERYSITCDNTIFLFFNTRLKLLLYILGQVCTTKHIPGGKDGSKESMTQLNIIDILEKGSPGVSA